MQNSCNANFLIRSILIPLATGLDEVRKVAMLFGKANYLVGLDIGSAMVKVAEVVPSRKGQTLKAFGGLPLKPGAIKDGVIRDGEHVAGVIRKLFLQHKIRNAKVALSIGGYSAIVKKIVMPVMDDDSLQKSLLVEAEQYIPFDIKDMRMDFRIMGSVAQNPNQLNILLIAVKSAVVNQHVDVVALAGLTACVVDVDAFAVQNMHEQIHGLDDEEVILLHVGAAKMSLNIVKNGDSIFMRDVSLGSRQINFKIRATLACSEEEAEELKLRGGGEKMSSTDLAGIVEEIVGQWCAEIGRALDFFHSASSAGDCVKRIVVSGGGAHTEGFVDALARQTGAEVTVLDSFSGVYVDAERFDKHYIRRMAPQASVCMGLALRKVGDK